MIKSRFLLFFFLLTFGFSGFLKAQYYASGQDPASLKWNQINSDNFQIIYPRGYDSIAQYVMNVMEYGRFLTLQNRDIAPKKISVILHNQTIISNAEVAWSPRRMEFYTVTPQSTYSQPWFEQLAIHEYVHVLQISAMEQGFTKFLYYLFGEQITVGIFGLYVPYWFIEGEAVVDETALSKSGRGRDPNFEMELRAQVLEKGAYSLEKASLGSYKDFTTDRYHLGYFLVGQGRVKYGKDMWNKTLSNVAKFPLAIVPFGQGIKTKTGLDKKSYYEQTIDELSLEWTRQLQASNPDNFDILSENKTYTNYNFNQYLNDGNILSLKENLHKIGELVITNEDGEEERLFKPGFYVRDQFSVGGDLICWSEMDYDPRWEYKTNSKIILLNYKTKEKKTLLKGKRYFSPAISPSGEKIAVVEVDEFSHHYLVILNSENGDIISRIRTHNNDFIAHPSWSEKEDKIVFEALNENGKTLVIYQLENHHFVQILPYENTHMQYPTFWKDYVLFEAAYSGLMNVFALHIPTKSLYQTTNVAFGAGNYQVSPNGQKLVFSNYTAWGNQLAIQSWKKEDWIPFSEVKDLSYPLADRLSEQVDSSMISEAIPQEEYEIKKYNKATHLLNIHSWGLLNVDVNNNTLNPGISILSQNKLSTLAAKLGIDYNLNTQSPRYFAEIDYLGWYPAFSLRADYGRRMIDIVEGQDTIRHYWYESNMSAGVYVPLLFTNGLWSHRFQPEASFTYKQIDQGSELNFRLRNLKTTNYLLQYSAAQKTPYQNLFPHWGYSTFISYQESPFDIKVGSMWSVGLTTYWPGFFKHDGFRLLGQYQNKQGEADYYSDMVGLARGYTSIYYNDLLSLRADYKVPLLYPDWNLSSLLYVKRVVMGLFYDYSLLTDVPAAHHQNYFWSSGVDLTADVHFLRSKFPFQLGMRTTYLDGYINNANGVYFQLLWGFGI